MVRGVLALAEGRGEEGSDLFDQKRGKRDKNGAASKLSERKSVWDRTTREEGRKKCLTQQEGRDFSNSMGEGRKEPVERNEKPAST